MIDATQLDALVHDLDQMDHRVQHGVEALANRAGLNMKRDWAARWTGMKALPHLPHAVSYDLTSGPGWAEVEVGPDLGKRQGPLGGIVEFGTSTQAPKRPVGQQVLDAEGEKIDRLLADIGSKL